MQLECTLDGQEVNPINVSCNYSLNDFGGVSIAIDTNKMTSNGRLIKNFYTNVQNYYLKDIEIKVNGDICFKGKCTNINSGASSGNYSLVMTGISDWITAIQTNSIFTSFQMMTPASRISSIFSIVNFNAALDNAFAIEDTNIWDILYIFMKYMFEKIFTNTNTFEDNDIGNFFSKSQDALNKLLDSGQKISLLTFLDTIKQYNMISIPFDRLEVKSLLDIVMSQNNNSIWNMLITFAERFLFNLGSYKNILYVFPSAPFLKAQKEIEDIVSFNVDPIPIQINTRVLVDIERSQYAQLIVGTYPNAEDNAGELTELEKTLKVVNPLRIKLPILRKSNDTMIDNMDAFAEGLYIKELFKRRFATIQTKFDNSFYVGQIVSFVDTFFERIYTGQIYKINHDFPSCITTITLQYTIALDERITFGIKDNYNNPLYPNFNGLIIEGVS